MRCPYCQNPLQADATECPACRLTFPRACTLLGAMPRLSPVISDTAGLIPPSGHTRIRRRISGIQWRFPQLALQIVVHEFPPAHPLQLHVFWLFNSGAFAGEARRGKNNHALLLLIDPGRAEAAIMPGYGLETLLPREALEHLLELAGPAWADAKWPEGILRVLDGLDQLLESIAIHDNAPASGEF